MFICSALLGCNDMLSARYVVEASVTGTAGPWTQIASGQSIGNKWIVLLPNASGMIAGAVRVRVTEAANGDMSLAQIASVGIFKCNRPSDNGTG